MATLFPIDPSQTQPSRQPLSITGIRGKLPWFLTLVLDSGDQLGLRGAKAKSACPGRCSWPGGHTEASGLGSQAPGLALLAAMGWLPTYSQTPGGPTSYTGTFPCLCLVAATLVPTKLSCHILCLPALPAVSSHFPSATTKQSELTAWAMFPPGLDALAWDRLKPACPQDVSAASC